MPASSADALPGIGLYVHWPFCAAKCPYCDFNSHVRRAVDHAAWRNALITELRHMAERAGPRRLESVFFGGGTPSLMEPGTVSAILDEAARLWQPTDGMEVTLEANPTSAEADRFKGYRLAGVNRVSLGVQALNDTDLADLGRRHTVKEALDAVAMASGLFERISFDLIYARPHQTPEAWRRELTQALDHAVDHLSLYQLTIEPGTAYYDLYTAGKLTVPDEDRALALFEVTQDVCEAAGLPAYEISNHAREDARSRHNLIYWRYEDYAGIGPGAHGRMTYDGGKHALSTKRSPEDWLAAVNTEGHGIETDEVLSPTDQAEEFLLMGLRLREGVDLERYRALAGTDLAPHKLDALEHDGLIARERSRLTVTPAGRPVLNGIIKDLAL